jgi:hypothetical protein
MLTNALRGALLVRRTVRQSCGRILVGPEPIVNNRDFDELKNETLILIAW